MSDVWLVIAPCALTLAVALIGLATVVPYFDGRDEAHRDKWIRAHKLAWACWKRGKRRERRRRHKLLARYEARKDERP